MMALEALAHSELEQLKYFSHNPSLEYKGSIGCRLLSKIKTYSNQGFTIDSQL